MMLYLNNNKDLGLKIRQSNLCSEITLPTNEERTAVCCLSSVNLEHFDEWVSDNYFIEDLITMLDNVIEHYIENAVDTSQLGGYSANFKRFKNILKKVKKGLPSLLIRLIEKGLGSWVQWVSMLTYSLEIFLSKVFSQPASIIKHLNTLNQSCSSY